MNNDEKEVRHRMKAPSCEQINKRYEKCVDFNNQIGLYDTVEVNEDFFNGDQWKGVQANGLPTPVFNFLQQIVNFVCATTSSDNLAVKATPLPSTSRFTVKELDRIVEIVNHQYGAIIERNAIVVKAREMLRNAAVHGDGCMYFYFDSNVENGQEVKGEIRAEIIDNVRVHFGNPNCREVQKQPYIIISRREMVDDVQYRAEQMHNAGLNRITDPESIQTDEEKFNNVYDSYANDKVTVLTYMYRNRETGTVWFVEATQNNIIREAYDTGYKLYPLVWLNWNPVRDCYHGKAMLTSLIPNQTFVNKMYAMNGVCAISMGFPTIIYDKTRVDKWNPDLGAAIGVNGNVNDIAKILEGAAANPQTYQLIDMSVAMTRSFLGASDVALGDSRPDNTSAIIALQRAAATPTEITKQAYHETIDDMGKIWTDMMSVRYGVRDVEIRPESETPDIPGVPVLPQEPVMVPFDFDDLKEVQLSIKREVGASSYWSEMASQQTLDNLLMQGLITLKQYLERLPEGYIVKKQELIDELKAASAVPPMAPTEEAVPTEELNSEEIEPVGGPGNGALQRALNEEGANV